MKTWMIVLIVIAAVVLLIIIISAALAAKRRREEEEFAQRVFDKSVQMGFQFGYDHPKAGAVLGGLGLLASIFLNKKR